MESNPTLTATVATVPALEAGLFLAPAGLLSHPMHGCGFEVSGVFLSLRQLANAQFFTLNAVTSANLRSFFADGGR